METTDPMGSGGGGAVIGRTIAESTPHWPEPPHPGEDAPNVLVILLDDTGFAQLGCFGSTIDTPNIDRLAAEGIRFTNFHTTPLCSPTRASLLTGRSSHLAGMRAIANFQTGFPHQLGYVNERTATMAEVLQGAGYATFCVGKWHLAPLDQCSAAGPFDHWPLRRGFDRFYGFLEGETDQFHPQLVVDNHPVEPPASPAEGYHLSEDLVTQLLAMISDSKGVRPDRPFFAYLPFGATHAPHQAPAAYLDKYRGAFDEGWDVLRERWFDRQKELGVIPEHTVLADRNPGVDAWDSLGEDQRRLAARLQEAFAAFLDHTDDQIGRLLEGLATIGQLDNTIVVLASDNGASQEGGPYGVMHEMKFFNFLIETPEEAVQRIDDIGGPHSHTNYPWGWAQCGNTPFRWYKQNTHEGGVHVPLIVRWADRLEGQAGTVRRHFIDVADVAPTLYDLVGVTPPDRIRGVDQLPITGRSFAPVVLDPEASGTNDEQYYEMMGSRALVRWPYKAVCKHVPGADYDEERWELFELEADPSETRDLADAEPDRLAEMIDGWWDEAEANGVLPLDDRGIELFGVRFRDRSPHAMSRTYRYRPPMSPIPSQAAAPIGGRNFVLSASITRSEGDGGVVFATGTENAGLSVFVDGDRWVLDYNAFGEHTVVESSEAVPIGASTLGLSMVRDEARGARAELTIDGRPVGGADIGFYMRIISSVGASVGLDSGSAVSPRYAAPNPFTGTLHEVRIELAAARAAEVDAARQRAGFAQQ